MKKLADQIERLERSFFDDFTWNSTFIDPSCLTMAEKRLFEHVSHITPPRKPEEFKEFDDLLHKTVYYRIRRAVDYLMKTMEIQLVNPVGEWFLFWIRFIDFLSETMFIINRNRGSDILLEMKLGEDPKDWPQDDDPLWKEFEDADNKWNRDFKEFWDYTSITMDKIFAEMKENLHEKHESVTKKSPSSLNKSFGEIITSYLSRPSIVDIAGLVELSKSDKTKTLMEILSERQLEQNEEIE